VASRLAGSAKPSVNATSPARTGAPKRHLRQTARTRASQARQGAALAPARFGARPPASAGGAAVDATSDTPGASSERTGTAERAKAAGAAVSIQDRPARSGPPVHPVHPRGAGANAVQGKPTTATSHARGSGATGAARSAHGSDTPTRRGRESTGAVSGSGHTDGSQGRPNEPASANQGTNPEHGRPAETSNAPPPQPEPSRPAGEKLSPPAHEEAGGHGLGGQHGGAVASSP
jgi:hypothetical protein